MQQYFYKENLDLNKLYILDDETLHHIKTVLRKSDGYKFRLIDLNEKIYLCTLEGNSARVLEELKEDSELSIDVTVIVSLIKNDKFDLILQKLTELGVKRIVPFMANRSIIKIKDKEHKLERFRKIVKEASEQSHRSFIPVIDDIIDIKNVEKYKSKYNYIAYEKTKGDYIPYFDIDDSVTVVIGPEGGFEVSEVEKFESLGFEAKSLGKRILRAETAAIFVMSMFAGSDER